MQRYDDTGSERPQVRRWGMPVALVIVAGISAYTLVSLARERHNSEQLASSNRALNASLQQMQTEMRSVSDKLSALATQPPPAVVAPVAPAAQSKTRSAGRVSSRRAGDEVRWREMQTKVTEQQKEIASTKQQLDQTRQDLQSSLNSTRDELGGSIAKNHDELVALQKRGERNYYEFNLDKSKDFHRVGPLSLSVRKVNRKHRYYDLVMTVDDQQIERKHVSLYEPLMLRLADRPQPIELVVNQIDNNTVKGYISESKYKQSELASSTETPAGQDANPELQHRQP